ncbi:MULTISPECIES: type II toxin-antitoxin system VapC family toxin [Alphaproteobacteria]|uniref:PIN domain-containing protein n=2 Tax=Alphaproteobacteria TaxID=28211 RepID=A0A9W7NIG2_9PROT|nr:MULTISPECIES: type II toxin-antitoxin system VapC family toxin [Rhodospirillales]KAA0679540.1 PIN domain-containing protein [Roseomonas genomospecies 6]KAA0686237.1 PIN domain-containing protein [Azospirillum brasilense]
MSLVVDASVGLKWVLPEPDSPQALALLDSDEDLLVPDFWLNEATNVLWLQVRKGLMTPDQVRTRLKALMIALAPTPTADLNLHTAALEIGLAVNHSPYDCLYAAFAIAMGANRVVVADGPFLKAMRAHPESRMQGLLLPLAEWAQAAGGRAEGGGG